MLFNSYIFIFCFLPVVLLGFHLLGKYRDQRLALGWLVGASLFFYGWWNPPYLALILASIVLNYAIGRVLLDRPRQSVLVFGLLLNIALLGYFKYANFFIENIHMLGFDDMVLEQVVLPLAISFFTFQQIAYLCDAYKGETKDHSFLHYCLFVTFFPQLIAGPIVHHKEMLPQFLQKTTCRLSVDSLAIGLTIFFLGLFKKVVFADGCSEYATPIFNAADQGVALTFLEAWLGSLAYTFQLYFDFSGYSDMAIGLARMFGIVLPVNFFSPYKANNIIDFWRRWHITLSRFLKDYLYIPLGGNRRGATRRYINLMITMLLGGLWHGAGWTFVLWGALHGLYLIINHAWHALKSRVFGSQVTRSTVASRVLARGITFFAVVFAWVMFRSESLDGALVMYSAMLGGNGISLPVSLASQLGAFLDVSGVVFDGSFHNNIVGDVRTGWWLVLLLAVVSFYAPNTLEWMSQKNPALGLNHFKIMGHRRLYWQPTALFSAIMSMVVVYSLMKIPGASEFLYFRF